MTSIIRPKGIHNAAQASSQAHLSSDSKSHIFINIFAIGHCSKSFGFILFRFKVL